MTSKNSGVGPQALVAANTFTDALGLDGEEFAVGITGVWVGTVVIQALPPGGSVATAAHWVDLESFTANAARAGLRLPGGWLIRVGFKTGAYTSGTAICSVFRTVDAGQ